MKYRCRWMFYSDSAFGINGLRLREFGCSNKERIMQYLRQQSHVTVIIDKDCFPMTKVNNHFCWLYTVLLRFLLTASWQFKKVFIYTVISECWHTKMYFQRLYHHKLLWLGKGNTGIKTISLPCFRSRDDNLGAKGLFHSDYISGMDFIL